MKLALDLDKADELGSGDAFSLVEVTVTMVATDLHDLTSSRSMKFILVPHSDKLAFQLATGDSVNRHWGDGLWTGDNVIAAASAENYLTTNADIRTQAFASMQLGPRIRMEWILSNGIKAKAIYNVLPTYRDKTWLQVFAGGWNQRIATKDTLASTPGTPLVAAGYIRNANGNNGQPVSRPLRWSDRETLLELPVAQFPIWPHHFRLATPSLTLMRISLRT